MNTFEWLTIILGYSTLLFSVIVGAISMSVRIGKVESKFDAAGLRFEMIDYKIAMLQKSLDSLSNNLDVLNHSLHEMNTKLHQIDLSLVSMQFKSHRKRAV